MTQAKNLYLPIPVKVDDIIVETDDKNIKTFALRFLSDEDRQTFNFRCGQFAEVFVPGMGEAPFGVASSPMEERVEFTVSKAGILTTALHNMEAGQQIGVRGPLGNGFPVDDFAGKNLVLIGGGFGFTTLRSLANYVMHPENRSRFGDLTVVYGAREPGLLLYRPELEEWKARDGINLHLTIDKPAEGWTETVGFVPQVAEEVAPKPDNAYAIVCGPPIMIKFTLPILKNLGFSPEQVLLSLEMKMKCGVGMCGRCNIGSKFVCKDGPVFSLAELSELPDEY
ncbi:MAG: heterodisulfide reductase subunit F [Planctomycetes bacterium]|nr:heterodisulfide reductase subunit F [Planctomycetota bacterium]